MHRYLFRIIIPAFPSFSIYSGIADRITALGPIYVATSANKMDNWDVEVIDENNSVSRFCPRDNEGRPDHGKIQSERPADVVGFYASLTSTIPRVFLLSSFYKKKGAVIVAGGKHVEYMPEEALNNNIDIVVLREGEITIKEILSAVWNGSPFSEISGIVYQENGSVVRTHERPLISDFHMHPFPDFGLFRYGRLKIYPIARTRGCNSNCEFCAVKDRTRCATPQWMMAQVAHLVETRNAREFFEASDHFGADTKESIEFCRLLASYRKEKRIRIKMTVQIRISDARNTALLEAMKDAGIHLLAIGYESPIDEELITMKKGYLSKEMLKWTDTFHRYGFLIHGMFIFGYPGKKHEAKQITVKERVRRYRSFIRRGKIDTLQVLLAIPLPGTELRARLEKENCIYPLEEIGWEYYDGQFPLYEPNEDISPEDLLNSVCRIMGNFYKFRSFWNILVNITFQFPRIIFPSVLSLFSFRIRFINRAFNKWYRKYFRNHALRFGGYFIVRNWKKAYRSGNFPAKLRRARNILTRLNL